MATKHKKNATEDEFKTGPEIARILSLDPATIRRYSRDNGMPQHVLGEGMVRYKLEEVLAWLAQRKRKSKTEQQAEASPQAAGKRLKFSGAAK